MLSSCDGNVCVSAKVYLEDARGIGCFLKESAVSLMRSSRWVWHRGCHVAIPRVKISPAEVVRCAGTAAVFRRGNFARHLLHP